MIINGGSRSNAAFFVKHLTNGEHNERVTLCEMRKLAADNVPDAFRVMAAIAMGTLCENFFYHANINPRENEELTAEQWQIAVDTLERHLALTGHARFVVEHKKAGRTHRHVIWLRIDIQTMTAVVMANDYEKHQTAARELEDLFKLDKVPSVSGRTQASGPRPSRRPKTWESFRGQQSGIDPWKMKQEITQLYRASNSGAAFVSALEARGYTLARGNKAAFCIVDAAGHLHSLARRIEGVTATELTAFLRDIDPANRPTSPSPTPSAS